MALFASAVVLVDNSVLLLPSAWLLVLVAAAALLGGWRLGIAMTLIGAVALAIVINERNDELGLPGTRTVWAVAQFLMAGGGVSLAVGATDRAVREMRKAARALELSEQRAIEVTGKLQRAILPAMQPDIPGLRIAARYLPADASEVGGDFYDWYRATDGSWYLQIGDVCGKGPAAASRALLARYTLRTAAMLNGDPIGMLRALNDAILAEDDERYCTAAVLRFNLNGKPAADVDVVLGGHPHALVLYEDRVSRLGRAGSLLGLFESVELNCDRHELRPGDRLFLYTDGVTDRPGTAMSDAQLHRLLLDLNALPIDEFASELERRLLSTPGGRDDIAFFIIAVDEAGEAISETPSASTL
jgi:serine phosphatase RsbU (regulator of sigma subunit)